MITQQEIDDFKHGGFMEEVIYQKSNKMPVWACNNPLITLISQRHEQLERLEEELTKNPDHLSFRLARY